MDELTKKALEIVHRSPILLIGFNERIRGNKEVVLMACKKDHMTIRYATRELWKDTAFVYLTQDRTPEKLKALLQAYPYMSHQTKLSDVVAVYEDPIAFTELPKEAFKDQKFIATCKHAIGCRIQEIVGEDTTNKNKVGIANTIYRLVRETEDLRKLENNQIDKMECVVEQKSAEAIIEDLRNF